MSLRRHKLLYMDKCVCLLSRFVAPFPPRNDINTNYTGRCTFIMQEWTREKVQGVIVYSGLQPQCDLDGDTEIKSRINSYVDRECPFCVLNWKYNAAKSESNTKRPNNKAVGWHLSGEKWGSSKNRSKSPRKQKRAKFLTKSAATERKLPNSSVRDRIYSSRLSQSAQDHISLKAYATRWLVLKS